MLHAAQLGGAVASRLLRDYVMGPHGHNGNVAASDDPGQEGRFCRHNGNAASKDRWPQGYAQGGPPTRSATGEDGFHGK